LWELLRISGGRFSWKREKEKGTATFYIVARVFNIVHMRYAHYINRQRRVRGHLWQGRFYSCLLDDKHLYRAIRYIERNPVRAKIAKEAGKYEWSSARDHLQLRDKPPIKLKPYKK
jgi:hypothetical protein